MIVLLAIILNILIVDLIFCKIQNLSKLYIKKTSWNNNFFKIQESKNLILDLEKKEIKINIFAFIAMSIKYITTIIISKYIVEYKIEEISKYIIYGAIGLNILYCSTIKNDIKTIKNTSFNLYDKQKNELIEIIAKDLNLEFHGFLEEILLRKKNNKEHCIFIIKNKEILGQHKNLNDKILLWNKIDKCKTIDEIIKLINNTFSPLSKKELIKEKILNTGVKK